MPSGQKKWSQKMCKNRLSLTLFGRFLEVNIDSNWAVQIWSNWNWAVQMWSKSNFPPKTVQIWSNSAYFCTFFGFTFLGWWHNLFSILSNLGRNMVMLTLYYKQCSDCNRGKIGMPAGPRIGEWNGLRGPDKKWYFPPSLAAETRRILRLMFE